MPRGNGKAGESGIVSCLFDRKARGEWTRNTDSFQKEMAGRRLKPSGLHCGAVVARNG
jgi:hypothetical protein